MCSCGFLCFNGGLEGLVKGGVVSVVCPGDV